RRTEEARPVASIKARTQILGQWIAGLGRDCRDLGIPTAAAARAHISGELVTGSFCDWRGFCVGPPAAQEKKGAKVKKLTHGSPSYNTSTIPERVPFGSNYFNGWHREMVP